MDSPSPGASTVLNLLGISYEEALSFARGHVLGKRILVASIVILLYDNLTTLDQEIRYVWRVSNKFSFAKLLFAMNRYLPAPGLLIRFIFFEYQKSGRPLCGLAKIATYASLVNFGTMELVLMTRVWVLYKKSRNMGFFLGALFVIGCIIALVVRQIQPKISLPVAPLPLAIFTVCKRTSPDEYFLLYLTGLCMEIISFSLLLWKVYRLRKESLTAPILKALILHGTGYYLMICLLLGFALGSTMSTALFWPFVHSGIVTSLSCVAGNHLILSLRGLYHTDPTPAASTTCGDSHQLTTLKFHNRTSRQEDDLHTQDQTRPSILSLPETLGSTVAERTSNDHELTQPVRDQ